MLILEKLILVIEGEKQTLDTTIFDSLDKYEKPKEFFLYHSLSKLQMER
jgi:hypothetical protein